MHWRLEPLNIPADKCLCFMKIIHKMPRVLDLPVNLILVVRIDTRYQLTTIAV
jgi:hypothetical protein